MPVHQKKRQFELGRVPANTKLGDKRVRPLRVRGGNMKFRALRLNEGNFNWASEGIAKKTKIVDVIYNASNNELVRTKTLVKNCIVTIDATPFKQWYLKHYNVEIGKKMKAEDKKDQKKSKHLTAKLEQRKKDRVIDQKVSISFRF